MQTLPLCLPHLWRQKEVQWVFQRTSWTASTAWHPASYFSQLSTAKSPQRFRNDQEKSRGGWFVYLRYCIPAVKVYLLSTRKHSSPHTTHERWGRVDRNYLWQWATYSWQWVVINSLMWASSLSESTPGLGRATFQGSSHEGPGIEGYHIRTTERPQHRPTWEGGRGQNTNM